jgi:hypothetical protein
VSPLLTASLRQLLLVLVFIGIIGLAIELLLLRHAESFTQLIPHVTLAIGLIATGAVYFRPGSHTIKTFQLAMLLFLLVGLLGIFFHLRGNVEFALERDPSLSGMKLVSKVLRGATPALAPGALVQLGLLGLIFTYRHPALTGSSRSSLESVD